MTEIDVLVPSRDRPAELATTLAGLAAQEGPDFSVTISDQSDGEPSYACPAASSMVRVLRYKGKPVSLLRNLPRRGLAQQRAFLLSRASAPYVLFLDDDVWLEPGTLAKLHEAITTLGCGFVGNAVQGLSYLDDVRPHELAPYEEWRTPPIPESVEPGSTEWSRWTLHNAANPTHLAERLRLRPGDWRAYKIAWVGGCVLFDRAKLEAVGGFDFWTDLPEEHSGEDVLAQHRVMAKAGGAGILPSGAVHLEAPTTVPNREVDAARVVQPSANATNRS
ncbi:glycosyltransferase [Allokutzneria albata]|uniref:Glycosyl transferase family 2 n=1 Tax=Allokutzneria albata TaxID=211114 RepID=A0A1G9S1C2_ALLAB|nr:glycosyltransferase [Allokutzneria albata]SDM29289.1 Glycosyl transferase family 2 [Allokutzneria albata]